MIQEKIARILVPLDGSENSVRGLETAITLAKNCGASITGIYAIQSRASSEFGGSVEEPVSAEVQKILDDAKALAAENGVVLEEKIARGEIGYNIVNLAQGEDKCDMIVMGSRGRSSAKKMLFGSVSNYVIRTAKIPVVIVK